MLNALPSLDLKDVGPLCTHTAVVAVLADELVLNG
jgi:hypothetical protein